LCFEVVDPDLLVALAKEVDTATNEGLADAYRPEIGQAGADTALADLERESGPHNAERLALAGSVFGSLGASTGFFDIGAMLACCGEARCRCALNE